jgi:DNA-binding IclR family transcriptional regulator
MQETEIEVHEAGEPAVKTIDRAVRLLWVLAKGDSEGMPLSEIGRHSGFGKGTTHRLLAALIEAGLAFQDPTTRRYRFGASLSLLARFAQRQDIGALSFPSLERVAKATSDTVYVSVRESAAAVCVGREIGSFPIRTLSLDVGDRRPLGVGSGSLALLAFLPDEEIKAALERNKVWLRDFQGHDSISVWKAVAKSRRNGFSFVDGRIIPGMNAIGVPVYDQSNKIVAALSLAAITSRVSGDRIQELVSVLKKEATVLSASLSANPAPMPATVG